ncbi:putative WD40-repeat-containing domain protein [Seiridium cardinale]|uniref:Mitochondrial division protein 1 n=1 Tax=Seiridium cardinale TaxID=138064 RepID=A0ABR2XEE2_9PEZI
MEDFDRDSNASSEEQEDELMIDAEEPEDNEQPEDNDQDDDDNDGDDDDEGDNEDDDDNTQDQQSRSNNDTSDSQPVVTRTSATPAPTATPRWQASVRPEYLTASTYDIVPTMAAPMATSINAISITPDLRYWMTGGSDGYIRKYHGPDTINGKQLLTVAQRHPFVESVVKAGVLLSYWENAEPHSPSQRTEDLILSPVYSLAVHSQALWLLSGLESGGINLQSVRHDEGKRITCLQKHTNAVSVLNLAADEKSVLSGSWDKSIFDWDLNTGEVRRQFDGTGGQISVLETRPMGGMPIPPEAAEEDLLGETFFSNNAAPATSGDYDFSLDGVNGGISGETKGNIGDSFGDANGATDGGADGEGMDAQGSPTHDSLFGGSPGAGDDLFGDNFGGDDDNEFSRAMMQDSAQDPSTNPSGAETTLPDFDMSVPTIHGPTHDAPNEPMSGEPTSGEPTSGEPAAGGDVAVDTSFDMTQPSEQITDFSTEHLSTQQDAPQSPSAIFDSAPAPQSPSAIFAEPLPAHYDTSQTSDSTFLSASIDGTLKIWDRRVPNPVARIANRFGIPPWCMGACWSPDGNWIYVGRRNGTVEEYSIEKARGGRKGWTPERTFKFPGGSGPVSCVRPMPNGRHLICASHDILRLYDLRAEEKSSRHSPPPFLIVPGPPRAGVISSLYIDATGRFMISAAGTRGWEGTSTEVMIGYEIGVPV